MGFRTALLFVLLIAVATFAQDAVQQARPLLNGLSLKAYTVEIEADESIATAVVTETFFNSGRALAEADFLFPLAPGATPTGLQLNMAGSFEGGNLLSRKRAREIYREITGRRRDPALLDCVGKDLYRCRVFPIAGNSDSSVRFSYRQPLQSDGEIRRLVVPLDATRFNRSPAGICSIRIHVKTEKALQAILCPTHEVRIRRLGVNEAVVHLEVRNAILARDLVLHYSVEDAPMGAVVASYKRSGERGFFVLSIDAAFAREKQKLAPRDVVLAVDTSNSTGRNGIDAAAAALARALDSLRPYDRYALVSFGSEAQVLREFGAVGNQDAETIRKLLSAHPVAGRTRLGAALNDALEIAAQGRPGTGIVMMTDGRTDEDLETTVAVADRISEAGHRLGMCGLGSELDTVNLDALGEHGDGDSCYSIKGRGLDASVRHLMESTRAVPLTDTEVHIEGVAELYPRRLRVLKPGDSILVAGRYARGGEVTVRLSGRVGGERVTRTLTVQFETNGGDPAVARVWAARRVGYLLERARRLRSQNRYEEEIRSLGKRYGIVTPFTSMLVLESADQKRYLGGMKRRPLMSSGGGEMVQRATVTREFSPSADLADRIKRLQRSGSEDVNPFADLLGKNRMRLREAAGRTFYRAENGCWIESDLVGAEPAQPQVVRFLSKEWQQLVDGDEDAARVCSLGPSVLFVAGDGTAYRVVE